MENEKQLKSAYRRLRIMRYKFSDVIPTEPVYSGSKNNKYKCRKMWWGNVRDGLHVLQKVNALPVEMQKRFDEIWQRYTAVVRKDEYGVKPENIREANELLDAVIGQLEARLR